MAKFLSNYAFLTEVYMHKASAHNVYLLNTFSLVILEVREIEDSKDATRKED